jgi:hypothetical protein
MGRGSAISGSLQQVSILNEVTQKLKQEHGRLTHEQEQAILLAWYDLFRSGHLSWGYNLNNPEPPFCHVTEQGRRTLAHISRDPSNTDGYLAHLTSRAALTPLALAYVDEALGTYNTNRFRAAAVMIGVASERALDLRDALTTGIAKLGRSPSASFTHMNIKRVLEAIRKELEMHQKDMEAKLWEQVDAYWPAFVQQIRAVRNDAGHPAALDLTTPETVHAALLIFPEFAQLTTALIAWANGFYT